MCVCVMAEGKCVCDGRGPAAPFERRCWQLPEADIALSWKSDQRWKRCLLNAAQTYSLTCKRS